MTRAALVALAFAACSTNAPPEGPRTCTLDLSGNRTANSQVTSCATVSKSDAGRELFAVDATTTIGHVHVSIDVGATLPTGMLTSADVVTWSASVVGNDDGGCVLSAGSTAVPEGNFTLSSFEAPDAGAPRGILDVVLYVQAATATDCGPTDTEYVHVVF